MAEEKKAKPGIFQRLLGFFGLGKKALPQPFADAKARGKTPAAIAKPDEKQQPKIPLKKAKLRKSAKERLKLSRKSERRLRADLAVWKRKVEKLTGKITALEKSLGKKKIKPKEAEGQIKVVYTKLNEESRDINSEIKYNSALMKRLEHEYFKRRINDSEFRQKMLDYREKQYLLQMKDTELKKQKKNASNLSEKIGGAILIQQPLSARPVQYVTAVPAAPSGEPAKKYIAVEAAEQRPRQATKIAPEEAGGAYEQEIVEQPFADRTVIDQIIEHKARGKIDEEKLKELESRVGHIAAQYNIPAKEIEREVSSLDTRTMLESFNRLVSLLELEHKAKIIPEKQKAASLREILQYGISKDLEKEVKGIAVELQKHRIVTDFDKIFSAITEKGKASIGNISKNLGIEKKRVMECAEILESNGLVTINYPAIGDANIQLKDYVQKAKTKGAK